MKKKVILFIAVCLSFTTAASPTSPPIITAQPTDATVLQGATATFTLSATGSGPLTYQWQLNETNIGAPSSSSTYTTPPLTLTNNGDKYRCVVSDGTNSVTSNAATVTVNPLPPPVISKNPQSQTVVLGASVTFTLTATGSGLSYQWQNNQIDISGAISASYTINPTTHDDSGHAFRCVVSNGGGSVTSTEATLTVNPPAPIVTINPLSKTDIEGSTDTFSVVATGSNLTYQWQKNLVNIPNSNAPSYIVQGASMADNGAKFLCVVSNPWGSATSTQATLTIKRIITANPSNQTAVEGASATFSISVATGSTPSYKWQKNSTDIPGATAPTYSISSVSITDSGASIRCIATNGPASDTSTQATLTVQRIITANPTNQTAVEGASATFSISVATGSTPIYKWQKNSTDIPGATSPAYIVQNVALTDNGATFRCIATNGTESDTSKAAILTVNTIIKINPSNQTVIEGGSDTFSIVANGSSLTYKWQRNSVDISGATASMYIMKNISLLDNQATFRCIVSNAGSIDTSATATLTVIALAPVITTNPINAAVIVGSTATFSVAATGSNLTYQWQKNSADILNATSPNYTTPALLLTNNGEAYRCIVSNSGGRDTSTAALLTVNPPAPVIATNPSDKTIVEGNTTVFSVVATGINLNYQWQRDTVNIPGANAASYTTKVESLADNGAKFRCIVSNGGGSVASTAATLTVNMAPPKITSQPTNQFSREGATATFSVTVTGSNLTYQWQKNSANIPNANAASYTTPILTLADTNSNYRCFISNDAGSVWSTVAVLTVNVASPIIIANPTSKTVLEGTVATFSVTVAGSRLNYQWQKNGVAVIGATASTYTTAPVTINDDNATFKCLVSNAGGSVSSNTAVLTVLLAVPTIAVQPSNQTAPEGAMVQFSISATGTNLSYQWQKNGAPISGATSPTYTISTVALADNGLKFKCVVSNNAGSVTSAEVSLTVNSSAPMITTHPSSQTINTGFTATFSITASGPNLSFAWQKNGIAIPGATAASYTTPPQTRGDSGATFRCVVSNTAGSVTSSPATLTVITPTYLLTIGNNGNGFTSPGGTISVDYGDSLQIHATAFSSYRFDHWQVDSGKITIIDSVSPDTRVVGAKGNAVISALFTVAGCTLTVASSEGGRVAPQGKIVVSVGAPTTIIAIPDSGKKFDHWKTIAGAPFIADSTQDTTVAAMLGNAQIQAIFIGALCALRVQTDTGASSLTTVLDTFVRPGDTVGLKAPNLQSHRFIQWKITGGLATIIDTTSKQTKIIVSSAAVTVMAVFDKTGISFKRQEIAPKRFGVRFDAASGFLSYDIPALAIGSASRASIKIFDFGGRLLKALYPSTAGAGYYHVQITGGGISRGMLGKMPVLCVFQYGSLKKTLPLILVR